jgi:uncharacterized membrane protein YdbT with pleckstrin-like domain
MIDKMHISLTNLNIRESISILIAKIIILDLFLVIVLLYIFISGKGQGFIVGFNNITTGIIIIGIVVYLKIVCTFYIILQWLNEYYEISSGYILHNHGIIFRKVEHYRLSQFSTIKVGGSFFGMIFNFASITLSDTKFNKKLDMCFIHNARRYARILKELNPRFVIIWQKTEDYFK